jgi:hypothetical protein
MTVTFRTRDPASSSFTGWGASEDARTIEQDTRWDQLRLSDVVAYVDSHRRLLREIEEVFEKCASDNWDGYGAKGISVLTYANALAFLLRLPTNAPMAEITAEPDGDIAFEWYLSPDRVLAVSIGRDNTLTYAGRFGSATTYGTEIFEGDTPWTILKNLGRLHDC